MASTTKPVNGVSNGPLGKRKKTRENKGSYLSKWLDKTMHHIQESTPSMDTYDSYINSNINWPVTNIQCPPNLDPCRYNLYGCAPEPMSLPTIPTYYNPTMQGGYYPDYRYVQSANKSIQVHRPRQRRRSDNKAEDVTNGSFNSYLQTKTFNDSQDFASLPPIVTSVADTTSNSDLNANDKDVSNARRFSDPCVGGLPDVARPAGGEGDTASESSSGLSGSHIGSKLLTCLIDQITTLKMTNEKLHKDLQETKAELHAVKQQNILWQKGSGNNLGVASNHSLLGNNGFFGPGYSPGVLTDVVREIREAARVREEALYTRVRAMVLERNDNNGLGTMESKLSERSLEDIKSSIRASEADKRRMMDRIAKLEDELRILRSANGLESNEGNPPVIGNEEDLRKELADMRKAKQHSDEHSLKLERIVTQLRSKFNGLQISSANGPESLPSSEPEHEANSRARRTSVNSSNNSTVVFGPVTDL